MKLVEAKSRQPKPPHDNSDYIGLLRKIVLSLASSGKEPFQKKEKMPIGGLGGKPDLMWANEFIQVIFHDSTHSENRYIEVKMDPADYEKTSGKAQNRRSFKKVAESVHEKIRSMEGEGNFWSDDDIQWDPDENVYFFDLRLHKN